jgi:hypothetical protein
LALGARLGKFVNLSDDLLKKKFKVSSRIKYEGKKNFEGLLPPRSGSK